MQDFFCPHCGRRTMSGHCSCQDKKNTAAKKAAANDEPQEIVITLIDHSSENVSAPDKIISIDDVRSKNNDNSRSGGGAKAKRSGKAGSKKSGGVSAKGGALTQNSVKDFVGRAAERVKSGVKAFEKLVDELVNPEEE